MLEYTTDRTLRQADIVQILLVMSVIYMHTLICGQSYALEKKSSVAFELDVLFGMLVRS